MNGNETSRDSLCLVCETSFLGPNLIEHPYPKGNKTDGPAKIIQCPHCGVARAEPFPTEKEMDEIFNWTDFWQNDDKQKIRYKHYPVAAGLGRARVNLVLKHHQGSFEDVSILDIGAGQGFFGIEASQILGPQISKYSVVDFDPLMRAGISEAWEYFGFRSLYDHHEQLEEVGGQYDIVVLSHVLEHVRNPREFIQMSLNLLKPGGSIFIDVPHNDYRFKPDIFPHIYFYSPESLKELLNRTGGVEVLHSRAWGRYHDQSILGRMLASAYRQFFRVAYHLNGKIPVKLIIKLYAHLYGANCQKPNGTWVRLIAKKEI